MKTNYEINSKAKTITVKMGSITPKQLKLVKNYVELGYKLIEYVKPTNDKFKKETIKNFLDQNGTKEQIAKYNELYNTPQIDKDTKKQKLTKAGKPMVKGHIATLQWFKKEFPNY